MRAPTTAPRARTGCDLQRIDDVTVAIRDFGDRYLDRVYTRAEQEAGRLGGAASLAARFAAKEAVLKALGAGLGACKFVEIEVVRAESGAPDVVLHGAAVTLATDAGVRRLHLSLTHTEARATAFVIAES